MSIYDHFHVFSYPEDCNPLLLARACYALTQEVLKTYQHPEPRPYGAFGMHLQLKMDADLKATRHALFDFARPLMKQINDKVAATPAKNLSIVWPEGTLQKYQHGSTDKDSHYEYTLGNRTIANVFNHPVDSHFCVKQVGFYLQPSGQDILVMVAPPEEFVTTFKDQQYLVRRYRQVAWNRGAAWSDLVKHHPFGDGDRNPWRKAHNGSFWQWRCPHAPTETL